MALSLSERKYVRGKVFAPVGLNRNFRPGGRRSDDLYSVLESDAGLLDLRARDRRIPREGLMDLNALPGRRVRHPIPRAIARRSALMVQVLFAFESFFFIRACCYFVYLRSRRSRSRRGKKLRVDARSRKSPPAQFCRNLSG